MRMFLATISIVCLSQFSASAAESPTRATVQKGLEFLEEKGAAFAKSKSCITCHHSPMMAWALTEASRSGFAVDVELADKTTDAALKKLIKLQKSYQSKQWSHTLASFYIMSQIDQAQLSRRQATFDQLVPVILEGQNKSGEWRAAGQFSGQRRPQGEAHQVQTMWTLLALSKLKPDHENLPTAIESAKDWLAQQPAVETIDARVLRVILEKQSGSADNLQEKITQLIEAQNEDGGWGWHVGDSSDAWATGMVLYASSVLADPQLSQKIVAGQKFLESSQLEDGSWLVASKLKSKNGKEREGKISSFFGTVWAVIGLCRMETDISAGDADKTSRLD